MDVVLIIVIAVAAIAVIALLVALSRRSQARRQQIHEARDVARESHARAELKEAEMHRARADVAQGDVEHERLKAELHETRAQAGYDGQEVPDRDALRERAAADDPDAPPAASPDPVPEERRRPAR